MRSFLTRGLSLALSTLAASPAHAIQEIIPVMVLGTLTAQGGMPGGDQTAVVTKVNNAVILEAFGVTKEKHFVALIGSTLAIRPKEGGGSSPVLTFQLGSAVHQTEPKIVRTYGTVSAAPQPGLLNDFQGAYTEISKPADDETKLSYNVIGASSAGLLKFKLKGFSGAQ